MTVPTFIFDENLLEKAIFIFVASIFVAGLCFSILGDIWEGVKELVEAVWDSALEAFGGSDIADLEGESFLEQIAKGLKKAVAVLKGLLDSPSWYLHIAPSLIIGLGGLVFPIYRLVRELYNIAQWPGFLGFSFYDTLVIFVNHIRTNLPFFVEGSLRYLCFLYIITGCLIWILEFLLFFTLLRISFKKKITPSFKSFLRKKLGNFLN